jgi:hypothetical protein
MAEAAKTPSTMGEVAPLPRPEGGITRPLGPGTFSPAPQIQTPIPNTSPAPVERNQPAVPADRGTL